MPDMLPAPEATQTKETLEIIYIDDHLVAIHKPHALLVHKSPIDRNETRYAMKILRDQLGKWVYPAHRLDKPTSGLLLFSFDSDTARALGEQFEQRHVEKRYQALVRGYTPDSGCIDHALKEIADFKDQQALADSKPAKEARTRYQTLHRYELPYSDGRFPSSRYSFIELTPETGRKHQLRRHLKHISHPIIGDVKYGKGPHNRLFRDKFEIQRLLLASIFLAFDHPHTGERLALSCTLAPEFQTLLESLDAFKV